MDSQPIPERERERERENPSAVRVPAPRPPSRQRPPPASAPLPPAPRSPCGDGTIRSSTSIYAHPWLFLFVPDCISAVVIEISQFPPPSPPRPISRLILTAAADDDDDDASCCSGCGRGGVCGINLDDKRRGKGEEEEEEESGTARTGEGMGSRELPRRSRNYPRLRPRLKIKMYVENT